MAELLSDARPVARKDRTCMASEWIINCGIDPLDLTFAERRALVIARRNGWKIKTGEVYVRQAVKCCGNIGTFSAIPAMHDLCLKYDMYEDC